MSFAQHYASTITGVQTTSTTHSRCIQVVLDVLLAFLCAVGVVQFSDDCFVHGDRESRLDYEIAALQNFVLGGAVWDGLERGH